MDGESNAAPSAPALSPRRELVEYTQLIYALHALTVVCAFLTMPVPVLRFAFCLPSFVAIIMNYLRRAQVQGSWLEAHFSWQIRTFWYAWLWTVVTDHCDPAAAVRCQLVAQPWGLGTDCPVGDVSCGSWMDGAACRPARTRFDGMNADI
jgi:uncharacterized membrane protein